MGNSLRCCLACVLPCGSFDVVRIVHLSGHIEEYTRPVTAGEVIAAHPNHVLSRPCSGQGGARRILIVDSDSELKRGCFYFLVPASSVPEKKRKPAQPPQQEKKKAAPPRPQKKTVPSAATVQAQVAKDRGDRYLSEVLSEGKQASLKRRRSVRATVWRPHLHSIVEEAYDQL